MSNKSTLKEIKKAYKKLALKYHPDKHKDLKESQKNNLDKKFNEINTAYQVLSNENTKKQYDYLGHDVYTSNASNGNSGSR